MRTLVLPFEYKLDCILNDLLVLSFLVGNDFLPHSPALAIDQDGLDRLFGAYKRMLPALGGYLLDGLDIVPQIVALNERRFAHHLNKRFFAWDLSACPIPHIQLASSDAPQPPDLVHLRRTLSSSDFDR